jgi:hypothetical protein
VWSDFTGRIDKGFSFLYTALIQTIKFDNVKMFGDSVSVGRF